MDTKTEIQIKSDASDASLKMILPEAGDEILEKVFLYSHDGIVIIDSDQETILAANPRMMQMLDYPVEEMNSIHVRDIHPDEMDGFKHFTDKVVKEGSGWTNELSCLTRHGQKLNAEISASYILFKGKSCLLAIIRDVTDRKILEKTLRDALDDIRTLSLEDELTGLHNRRGLFTLGEQHLKVARRIGKDVTVFFSDLDNFKTINDSYGHGAGDKALMLVADVFKSCFRETDILARYGGDEFVVISFDCDLDARHQIIDRIQREINIMSEVVQLGFPVSISFGTACHGIDGKISLESLIMQADEKMYQAKDQKKHMMP